MYYMHENIKYSYRYGHVKLVIIHITTPTNVLITLFIKVLIIHEENTKEITNVAEVLNRQETCVDSHKL